MAFLAAQMKEITGIDAFVNMPNAMSTKRKASALPPG